MRTPESRPNVHQEGSLSSLVELIVGVGVKTSSPGFVKADLKAALQLRLTDAAGGAIGSHSAPSSSRIFLVRSRLPSSTTKIRNSNSVTARAPHVPLVLCWQPRCTGSTIDRTTRHFAFRDGGF
jgi:hypothetical protein